MPKYMPKLPPLDPCPVEHVVELIGGKWKPRLLYRLRLSDTSLADLQRFLPGARSQVIAQQLGALEEDGIVLRLSPAAGQSWGNYTLTDRGKELLAAVDVIAGWGEADLGGWSAPTLR